MAPLRQRRDDVLPLAMRLLEIRSAPGARIPALSADAAQMLLAYTWPGNIRELDNLLQRALILANGPVVEPQHLSFESLVGACPGLGAAAAGETRAIVLRGSLRAAEQSILLSAIAGSGSRREVAQRLGISPRTLRYKLAQLRTSGIEVPAA
jgi:two-component system response regulator FlrC